MKYGLIGEHLSHSFSKDIHNMISSYDYSLCELSKDELKEFMNKHEFLGINVTIPYKEEVLKYVNVQDELVKRVGACNTIINKDGNLYAYNTDVLGFIKSLEVNNIDVKNKTALILGTGGASKAIKVALEELGINYIFFASRESKPNTVLYSKLNEIKEDIDVIVNCTPNGMYPNEDAEPLIHLSDFPNLESYIDLVYNPLNTNLMLEAKELGIKSINGLYMLVSQAVYAYSLFFNKEYDNELCDEIYKKIYIKKRNVVLIGMPSSGKTTVGRLLARHLNNEYVDTDRLIESRVSKRIKDYITEFGLNRFRELEVNTVKEVSNYNDKIIATGGGVVLNPLNMRRLAHNSIIIFIDRKLELLTPTDSRPLSSNQRDLERLYEERIDLYKKYADYRVENNTTLEDAMEKVIEVIKCF